MQYNNAISQGKVLLFVKEWWHKTYDKIYVHKIYVHGVGLGVPFCVSKMLKYAFSFPISTVVF